MFRKKLFPVASLAAAVIAVPTMATASSPTLELSVPVAECAAGDWIQVTTPDGAGSHDLDGDTLTITSDVIGDGVDHRFTVQTNKPVEGCHVTGAGVLTLDGAVVDPYQRDVAPGGANLQATWRPEEPGDDGDDSIPWTELEPADPVDPEDESIPWTELEPAEPAEDEEPTNEAEQETTEPPTTPTTPPGSHDTEADSSTSKEPADTSREEETKRAPKTLGADAEAATPVTANPRMAG